MLSISLANVLACFFLCVSCTQSIIPRLSSTSALGTVSLYDVIEKWTIVQNKNEETHPLKDAQQVQASSAQRKPLSYDFNKAAQSWTRVIPRY